MKVLKVNLFTILIFLLVLSVVLLVPSLVIQSFWNSAFGSSIETNMMIELWQAALLWGSCLCLIYMSGIFKFKIDLKTLDSVDLDQVDPSLRSEIEDLMQEVKKREEEEKAKEAAAKEAKIETPSHKDENRDSETK